MYMYIYHENGQFSPIVILTKFGPRSKATYTLAAILKIYKNLNLIGITSKLIHSLRACTCMYHKRYISFLLVTFQKNQIPFATSIYNVVQDL